MSPIDNNDISNTKLFEFVGELAEKMESGFAQMHKVIATKDDIKNMATKDDIKNTATKDDIKNMATKDDIALVLEKIEENKQAIKRLSECTDRDDQETLKIISHHEKRISALEKDLQILKAT